MPSSARRATKLTYSILLALGRSSWAALVRWRSTAISERVIAASTVPRYVASAVLLVRTFSDQAGHKPNQISPVEQPLVVDWTVTCGVGGSFNAKDWAPQFHL
jgi:hypothetical protein